MVWVPLHVHSQYSILDAAASVKDIAHKAAACKMPAAALTDHGNMYGAVDFFKACQAEGVKPILGCEVYVAPGTRFEKVRRPAGGKTAYHLVLLAKNSVGYHNLCKLSSIGFLEGFYYHPRIDKEALVKYHEGLVCLSACLSGSVASLALQGTKEQFLDEIQWYRDLFGKDYYLELQRHQMSEEDILRDGIDQETWLYQNYQDYISKQTKVNQMLLEAAEKFGIRCVATNDSHYMEREDWRAHQILLNIASGEPCEIWEKDSLGNPKNCVPNPKRRVYSSNEVYFKTPEQMRELFSDLPGLLECSLEIAEKCNVEIDFKTKHYPVFIPPSIENKPFTKEEQVKASEEYLWELCNAGIKKRYTQERLAKVQEIYPGKDPMSVVRERLEYEMSVISPKGMNDYLLIVYDFINRAKEKGIPMGPGRGSGAGSIICYLIEITDIEPLRFNLFFERFINPERISYPDIDVDICMDRRGEVIDYTLQKYGKENVAQIITFGTMKAKMAIKDVGRVLNVPLARVNAIAKLVPEDPNMTLDKALEIDPELFGLYQNDKEAKRVIDLAKKLEGSIRNTGIHAAGIIISAEELINHIPICNAKDSDIAATQYSMKPVEMVGMLKIDFLGLKTLTSIQKAVDAIKANTGVQIDWVNLPLDDQAAFEVLNQGKTLGLFQLESGGMQELARQLHLDKFEEIIAVVSLYRPGPMDMIPSFINRKHGKEPIDYDHPWMEEILSETYGIMVYQEQVMQIAQKLANYTLGAGDVLRRAMGKKDMAEMAKQREKFLLGALENGIDQETSMRIFDKMEKFAAYGFNKSHAAAYGYLSYVTAYLKAHYPKEWMAALMTCDCDDLSKVAKFIAESQSMGIPILSPDINESNAEFVATALGIRFAMKGIKGVGEGVVESIIAERRKGGAYTTFYSFFKRIDTSKVGKKAIENLVDAGCFDYTGWSRDMLRESIDPMYEVAVKEQKETAAGILTFFSLIGEDESQRFALPPQPQNRTSTIDLLIREKELLGFFLTGHPMDAYQTILSRLSTVPLGNVEQMEHNAVFRSAFIVESVQVRIAHKTQRKFAITMISDGIDRFELPIWSDLFEEKGHLLQENQLVYAVLQVDKREDVPKLACKWFDDLSQVNEATVEACDLAYDKAKSQNAWAQGARASSNKKMLSTADEKAKLENQKKSVPPMSDEKIYKVILDVEALRLTHILCIKKIFREYPGETPVQIIFQREGVSLGSLSIEKNWGISPSTELAVKLSSVPSILYTENEIFSA